MAGDVPEGVSEVAGPAVNRAVCPAAVLDAMTRAVIVTDTAGTVVQWNRAAENLYGWTAAEVVGRDVVDLLVPQSLSADAGRILDQLRAGQTWSGDFLVRCKDGAVLRVAVVDHGIVDADGTLVALVGESVDITTQRLVETELQLDRDSLVSAVAATRMGVWHWDRASGMVRWNETLEALFGLDPGASPGLFDQWIALVHPDDRARVMAALQQAIDDRGSFRVEHRVAGEGRSGRLLQSRGHVTVDGSGAVTGAVGGTIDVDDRTRPEEQPGPSWGATPIRCARDDRYPIFRGTPLVGDQAFAIAPWSTRTAGRSAPW